MKVTQVALRPTEASENAGRPSLTPELLAASGARYSRNNEGLEAILSKIDPNNLDKSVDSIFRMIDYGHQSIADMAPVAMFIDGVSLYLAYYIWSLCPTGSGEESSTRYINYGGGAIIAPEVLGMVELRDEWNTSVTACLAGYEDALAAWEELGARDASLTRIPRALLEDESDRAARQVQRMRRNYSFDRARNLLPVCLPTNVMLVMSARGWVQLCQHLLSCALPEAQAAGAAIADELKLAAPRLLKHAALQESNVAGLEREFQKLVERARSGAASHLQADATACDCPPGAKLEAHLPADVAADDMSDDLLHHPHRYAWVGESLKRTVVRFRWDAVALAEIRDLNRHRTGTKTCPLIPQGFYNALDEWPQGQAVPQALIGATETGRKTSARAYELLAAGDPTYIYWTLLGTQYPFEHVTTADKFIYEAELRTGTGAHFRYASHLRDVLALWYQKYPATRGLVLEGSAEPE